MREPIEFQAISWDRGGHTETEKNFSKEKGERHPGRGRITFLSIQTFARGRGDCIRFGPRKHVVRRATRYTNPERIALKGDRGGRIAKVNRNQEKGRGSIGGRTQKRTP